MSMVVGASYRSDEVSGISACADATAGSECERKHRESETAKQPGSGHGRLQLHAHRHATHLSIANRLRTPVRDAPSLPTGMFSNNIATIRSNPYNYSKMRSEYSRPILIQRILAGFFAPQ